MRKSPLPWVERYRQKYGDYESRKGDLHGLFLIPRGKGNRITVLSSGATDGRWEHVSVSLPKRCPTWEEMCRFKDAFWPENETAVQYHPRASEYVDQHKFCLHIWRDSEAGHTLPPNFMV